MQTRHALLVTCYKEIHIRVFISEDSVAAGGFDVAHLQESLTTLIQRFGSKGLCIFYLIFFFDLIWFYSGFSKYGKFTGKSWVLPWLTLEFSQFFSLYQRVEQEKKWSSVFFQKVDACWVLKSESFAWQNMKNTKKRNRFMHVGLKWEEVKKLMEDYKTMAILLGLC